MYINLLVTASVHAPLSRIDSHIYCTQLFMRRYKKIINIKLIYILSLLKNNKNNKQGQIRIKHC